MLIIKNILIKMIEKSLIQSIYELAILCKDCYSDFDNKNNYHKKIRNEEGLDCYLKKNNRTLIIIFVGTNEKKDWKTNLDFCRHYFNKNEYIHKGVFKTYTKSSKEIFKELEKIEFNKIIIIGHSLGGYLAQVLGYDLLEKYRIKSTIFIYGSGLIISKEIQRKLWKSNVIIFEIILKCDIVPNLLKLIYPSYYSIKMKIKEESNICKIKENHLMNKYIESFDKILF